MIRIPEPISFEWDEGNRDKNWVKHKVSNTEAEEVFFDPNKRLFHDVLHSAEEDRYILLGKTIAGRLLFFVFTIRENRVRIISARDMNRKERPLYEEEDTTT
jgi:uncharacterized DUF497 family protein